MSPSADLPMAGNVSPASPPGATHTTQRPWTVKLHLVATVAAFFSLTLTGCLLDFDQFDGRPTALNDAGDVVEHEDATPKADADAEADVDTDASPPDGGADGSDAEAVELVIGAACSADDECGAEGTCHEGYCTVECAFEDGCPSGSSCHSLGDEQFCLADCDATQQCDGVADRDDLSCVTLLDDTPLQAGSQRQWACLSDRDADQVADAVDNCPATPNPEQRNRDADGEGDACDDAPFCHAAADDGLLDFGAVDFEPADFNLPETTTLDWMPLVGGVDADGDATGSMMFLDRTAGVWVGPNELPYAARDRTMAATADNRYVITPGVLEDGQPEVGNYLLVDADGEVDFGPEYASSLNDKTLVSTGLGWLLAHGYNSSPSATTHDWSIERFDPDTSQFEVITSGSDSDRVQWHTTVDMAGNVIFYSKVLPSAHVSRLIQVDPAGEILQDEEVSLPEREAPATGQFNPFFVPGPGNVVYALDREVGTALRIDMNTHATTPTSELDLNLDTTADARFVSVPGSPSFLVIDRSSDDAQLTAREFFLPCLPGASGLDSDDDDVSDVIDNCPTTPNADQQDADRDSIGDECDPDADNDGIDNVADITLDDDGETEISLALDTDNDGTDNASDDDSDQDGLPDQKDRLPLDTDNDGIPNGLDDDDDADGYSDSNERAAGTDPLAAMSFPDAGTVSWVRVGDDSRSVQYAPIADTADQTSLSGGDDSAPHRPRFVDDGSSMFALADEPGTATGVVLFSTDPEADSPADRFELETRLRGVDIAADGFDGETLSSVVAAYLDDTTGQWHLGHINVADAVRSPLVTVFGDVWAPRVSADLVVFLGAPAGCDACTTLYRVGAGGGTPHAIGANLDYPTSLRIDADDYLLVAEASDGDGTSGYVLGDDGLVEVRPPGTREVDSLERAGSDGHLVVSARSDADEAFELWLFNNRTERWHQLLSEDDDLVEVDWIASVPPPADDTPSEPTEPDDSP